MVFYEFQEEGNKSRRGIHKFEICLRDLKPGGCGSVSGVARGNRKGWKQSMKAEDFGRYAY